MEMYSLRDVNEDDLPVICGFFANERELNYAFPDAAWPLGEKDLRHSIETRSNSSVLVYGGGAIGFANLFDIKNHIECCIGNVIIDRNNRRKGAAQFLIRAMADIALENYETTRIIIPCWRENITALMLYSKLGFRPFDNIIKEYGGGRRVPVVMLEKNYNDDVEEPSPVGTV
jgi:RimJ/RimL family protein N-acetyltransferase